VPDELPPLSIPLAPPFWATTHIDKLQIIVMTAILVFIFLLLFEPRISFSRIPAK
jgi:hypothetical protein